MKTYARAAVTAGQPAAGAARSAQSRTPRPAACSAQHDPCHCYRGPPISARTFEGSFSAVWVPTIARVGAFFHIFRDLQDSRSFAPLHNQIFVNFSFFYFCNFSHQISSFFAIFESISSVFEQMLMNFFRNFTGLKMPHKISAKSQILTS